jgi:RNA polymerase sigma factor for flagellar operon FliA
LIARRIFERIPDRMNFDDLVSAGVLGLIAAIDRYDARRDIKLRTYAEYKIRGAILDSLRGLDWIPRHQRKRSRRIESAIDVLEQEFQRTPEEAEIAAYLDLSVAEYQDWLTQSRGIIIASLEFASADGERSDLLSCVADSEQNWPSEIMERSQLEYALARAIDQSPAIERNVLSMYYYEEMTLREIAGMLHLHESRISQLKTQAILRLRALMEKRRRF